MELQAELKHCGQLAFTGRGGGNLPWEKAAKLVIQHPVVTPGIKYTQEKIIWTK